MNEDVASREKKATLQLRVRVDAANQLTLEKTSALMFADPASGKLDLILRSLDKTPERFPDPQALSQRLTTLFQQGNERTVVITGRRSARYVDMLGLVDAAKGAGANKSFCKSRTYHDSLASGKAFLAGVVVSHAAAS